LDELPNVECRNAKNIVCRNPSGKSEPTRGRNGIPEANQVEYVICPARIDDAVGASNRQRF
jgi:5-(carboxyamino)imidazole ribonucleotide synthase